MAAALEELGENLLSSYKTTTSLKDGIDVEELVKNMRTEFTLDRKAHEEMPDREKNIDQLFDYKDYEPFVNFDCLGTEESGGRKLPFDEIKTKMSPITNDGKVLKQVLRQGAGDSVPPNAVVYYHYNSYFEFEEIPFDSSYLRQQRPVRSQLGTGSFYLGFEISLSSMKVNEKARFLVEPEYAFGSLGVPPRIPPNALVLLEVELFKVLDCGAALEETDEMTDKLVVGFPEVYKRAQALCLLGNDAFQQGKYHDARDHYVRAERTLDKVGLNDDEEEQKYKKLLLKIYVNLCICYNKLNSPEKVCLIAKDAFHVCHETAPKSAKLLFNLAKAQLALNTFEKAKRNLWLASGLEPHNAEISKLLKEVEQKRKKSLEVEKLTYQRALGLSPAKNETPQEPESCSDLEKVLLQELQEFATNEIDAIDLPTAFTKEETQICKKICEKLGLKFNERMVCGRRHLSVSKS